MNEDNAKIKLFADYIEKQIGIIYSEANYFQLEHRLKEITKQLSYSNFDELWTRAKSGIDGQLRDLLLDIATNNETSFFRDESIFRALANNIVPNILAETNPQAKLRIWSAAGSTGQEAYSIAIILDQSRAQYGLKFDFEVFVSDISDRVLKRAKEGIYSQLELQRGMSDTLRAEYFDKKSADGEWQVKAKISDKLQFRKINLLEPMPDSIGMFDVIFCRNVLIYQSVPNKVLVIEKLLSHLSPKGYLVLGAAESMLGISTSVKQEQFGTAVAYKKI